MASLNERRQNKVNSILTHGKEFWYVYLLFLGITAGLVNLIHSTDDIRDIPNMKERLAKVEGETEDLKKMTRDFKNSIDRFNQLFDLFIKKGIEKQ